MKLTHFSLRTVILVVIVSLIATALTDVLLPYGPAVTMSTARGNLATFSAVDYDNESMLEPVGNLSKIYERVPPDGEPLLKGPETPLVDPRDGTLYALTEEANLVRLDDFQTPDPTHPHNITARCTVVVDLGVGRPLGGKITKNGEVYIADALLGLVRIPDLNAERPRVEIIASNVQIHERNSPLTYTNDLDVGPRTGHVYFSDASDVVPERVGTRTWDTMTAFKRDYSRGKPTGRLLRYKPETNTIDVLASDIFFANGVTVGDTDETVIYVSETSLARVIAVHLDGENVGGIQTAQNTDVLIDMLPGYPDGADCSLERRLCFFPMPSAASPIFLKLAKTSEMMSTVVRTLLMMLPPKVLSVIPVLPYGGVVEVSLDNDSKVESMRIIQDPHGKDIGMLTGVSSHDDFLYMGSLENKFIGRYELV